MMRISHALAAATILAGGAAIVAPAAAQKQKEQKAAPLKLSNEVRNPAAQAQQALAAKNLAGAEPLIAQAEAAAKTDDEKYIVATLRLNLEVQKLDQPGGNQQNLRGPLDTLLANPKTPKEDLGKFAYQRGVLALQAKNQAEATTYFERARQYGYTNADLDLQVIKSKMDSGDIAGGSADLEKLIAAQQAQGKKVDESFYRYAISKTSQKKMAPETLAWIEKYLAAYPTTKNWRDMVVFYGIQPQSVVTLDKGQKIDLYRMLRSSRALTDQYDYEIYGQWAYDVGLPYETKAVLNEGKAAGKVPASSANANSLLAAANKSISNEGSLASLEPRAKSAPNGKFAASTGDAYLGSGEWTKAIELYRLALQKGGVDTAAVNTRLGIAQANSGDKAGAKATFATVTTQPRADLARLWIAFIDHPPVG